MHMRARDEAENAMVAHFSYQYIVAHILAHILHDRDLFW